MVSSSSLKMKMTRIITIINTTTKLRRIPDSSVLHMMKKRITAIILAIKKEEPILIIKVAIVTITTTNKPIQMKTMTTPTVAATTPKAVTSTSMPRQLRRTVAQTLVSALNAPLAGGSSMNRR